MPPGVLPLSSLAGYLTPLWLSPHLAMRRAVNPSRSPGLAAENAVMATLPALSAAETRAAEALLARAWGPGTSVRAAEPIWDRSHVVRLHLATGRSVVMKKRVDKGTFGVELAALEYLSAMPEPVAPRLLGADADAGILLMEDLGPGRRRWLGARTPSSARPSRWAWPQ
jgi:hypothetical protein